MLLLPMTVGPFTLVRKLGTGGVSESYLGRLDADGGRPVVVRRILPYISRDPGRLASVEARVRDLVGLKHPFLVEVLDWVEDGDERFIIEAWVEGADLQRLLNAARAGARVLPPNVFLNIATQVCNGLEALHGRAGRGTGSSSVLHLGMKPDSIILTREGRALIGGYGLSRSPTALPHGAMSAPVPTRMEYLSPEQTQTTQQLTPASDIFSLGAILYELLTLDPLFRSESNLQTIHRIRKADVADALQRVRAIMPGLDKVLYRALSINPRHRYQRAFVLREDLRGLMASYSFSSIVDDTRRYLAPLLGPEDALSGESDDPELSLELSLDAPFDLAVGAPPPPLDIAPPRAAAAPETTEPDLAESERTDTLTAGLTAASVVAIAHPTLVPDGDDASASLSGAFDEAAAAAPLPEDPGFWAPPPVPPEAVPGLAPPAALEEIRPDSNPVEPTENHEPDIDLDALAPMLGVAGLAALGASAAAVAALAAPIPAGARMASRRRRTRTRTRTRTTRHRSTPASSWPGAAQAGPALGPSAGRPTPGRGPWLAEVGLLPPPPAPPSDLPEPDLPEPDLPEPDLLDALPAEPAMEPAPLAAMPPPPALPPLAPPLPDEAPSAELATEQIDPLRLGRPASAWTTPIPTAPRLSVGPCARPAGAPARGARRARSLPGFSLPPEAAPPVAAPPPVAAAPAEAPHPSAPTPAPAEDADPPRAGAATSGTSTLLIGIGLAAVALLVCGGGALWRLGSTDPAGEFAAAPAPAVPAPAAPAPAASAPAAPDAPPRRRRRRPTLLCRGSAGWAGRSRGPGSKRPPTPWRWPRPARHRRPPRRPPQRPGPACPP